MTLAHTTVTDDADALRAAGAAMTGLAGAVDRTVVGITTAFATDDIWTGTAATTRQQLLEATIGVLHRVGDVTNHIATAAHTLAEAIEHSRSTIGLLQASVPPPPQPPQPPPTAADLDTITAYQTERSVYDYRLDQHHTQIRRLQNRVDTTQQHIDTQRRRFADTCHQAATHLITNPTGPHWNWDRNLIATAHVNHDNPSTAPIHPDTDRG